MFDASGVINLQYLLSDNLKKRNKIVGGQHIRAVINILVNVYFSTCNTYLSHNYWSLLSPCRWLATEPLPTPSTRQCMAHTIRQVSVTFRVLRPIILSAKF